MREGASGAHESAEAAFLRSIRSAREQNALSWELRAATSLANLWRMDRASEARALLEEVLSRFQEGHETGDVRRATDLLVEMGAPPPASGLIPVVTRH